MKFCSQCGSGEISLQTPEGDNRLRYVCPDCQTVHYQNPKIIVGCLPLYENKVMLCKRAIEPRAGFWNFPAGFMENGETVEEGAKRETWEEAGAKVEIIRLHTIYNILHINQVYLVFLAKLQSLNWQLGHETLAAQLFEESEIPWQDLAFPSNYFTLKKYFADQQFGGVHIGGLKD
ncbi:MAG: NUDIX hydrolase [Microscillaceae bacterium]|nr:NUDIX hydrolase [Microscillaceae bacterium]